MHPLKENLFVYVCYTGKTTINVGNHHNITYHSKSLVMSHPCIFLRKYFLLLLGILLLLLLSFVNNNFPLWYLYCLSTRRMNECLTTSQHKNKSGIGYQTNETTYTATSLTNL